MQCRLTSIPWQTFFDDLLPGVPTVPVCIAVVLVSIIRATVLRVR